MVRDGLGGHELHVSIVHMTVHSAADVWGCEPSCEMVGRWILLPHGRVPQSERKGSEGWKMRNWVAD